MVLLKNIELIAVDPSGFIIGAAKDEINAELLHGARVDSPSVTVERTHQQGGGQMKSLFGLAGAGGFGRGVMPLVRQALDAEEMCCFIEKEAGEALVNGIECMSEDQFFERKEQKFFNIAIANSAMREDIAKKLIIRGAIPKKISCGSVKIFDDVEIGEGAILCSNTMITSNIKIGVFFHANIYSYVEHDCVIGDFVTFAPGVQCNGNVVIGDHCYIGAGAILRDGRPGKPLVIGERAVVGMGAVVVDDVPPGAIVAGNPARPLARGRMYDSRRASDSTSVGEPPQ